MTSVTYPRFPLRHNLDSTKESNEPGRFPLVATYSSEIAGCGNRRLEAAPCLQRSKRLRARKGDRPPADERVN